MQLLFLSKPITYTNVIMLFSQILKQWDCVTFVHLQTTDNWSTLTYRLDNIPLFSECIRFVLVIRIDPQLK